ncbi:hypothetical protein B0T10DRAFT_573972 [Thelonectria olida]|uniref:Uncharacterized protein n=1 Tax=Thelonectria olida TaxID=1576542 RepID=A0A9P9AKZ2_9HYPO|nr:hypothetical protein B0T10DRAFT_573972 [Thelonectria olida]
MTDAGVQIRKAERSDRSLFRGLRRTLGVDACDGGGALRALVEHGPHAMHHHSHALGIQRSRDCASSVFCMKPQRFENAQPSSVHFRLLPTASPYCRFRIAAWYDRGRQVAYNSLRWWAGSRVPGLVGSQRCLVVLCLPNGCATCSGVAMKGRAGHLDVVGILIMMLCLGWWLTSPAPPTRVPLSSEGEEKVGCEPHHHGAASAP